MVVLGHEVLIIVLLHVGVLVDPEYEVVGVVLDDVLVQLIPEVPPVLVELNKPERTEEESVDNERVEHEPLLVKLEEL